MPNIDKFSLYSFERDLKCMRSEQQCLVEHRVQNSWCSCEFKIWGHIVSTLQSKSGSFRFSLLSNWKEHSKDIHFQLDDEVKVAMTFFIKSRSAEFFVGMKKLVTRWKKKLMMFMALLYLTEKKSYFYFSFVSFR